MDITDRRNELQSPRYSKRGNRGSYRSNNACRGCRSNKQIPQWMMYSFMKYMTTNANQQNQQNNANNRRETRKSTRAEASQSQSQPSVLPGPINFFAHPNNGDENIHQIQQNTEEFDPSKYILDSVAKPTQVLKHTNNMSELTTSLVTLTSTSSNHDSTHCGTLQI